jgi:hypothetical protein
MVIAERNNQFRRGSPARFVHNTDGLVDLRTDGVGSSVFVLSLAHSDLTIRNWHKAGWDMS